jgi:hypothetical protein
MKLHSLVQHTNKGVYIVINHDLKRCYIACSTNILGSIERLIRDFKTDKKYGDLYKDYTTNLETFDIQILETIEEDCKSDYLRVRLAYWCKQYEDNGYTLYNAYKGLIYRVNTVVGQHNKIYVEVVGKADKRIVVGVFDKVYWADKFVQEKLSTFPIYPVYATNELTIKFLKRNK